MVKCKSLIILYLLLTAIPYSVFSQSSPDIPRIMEPQQDTLQFPNYTSMVFEKNLNTYRWNGMAKYEKVMGATSLHFNEQFLSSLIHIDQNLIRDEQSLDLSVQQRCTDRLNAAMKVASLSVSDNKSITLGNTASHAVYGGFTYEPVDRVTIEPLLGMRLDNQFNQHDKGPSYLLNLSSDSLEYEGYHTRMNGMMQYDFLTPRRQETRSAVVNIGRNFFEQTRNALQFEYYGNRRDFYFPADTTVQQQFHVLNNIGTRAENGLTISDSLDYDAGKNMLLSFQGNVFTRSIGRSTQYLTFVPGQQTPLNTTIDELKIDGGVKANYVRNKVFNAAIGFYYQERDEHHAIQPDNAAGQTDVDQQARKEELKNNHSRRTTLTSAMDIAISQSHSVAFSGSISLLRYDTPSAGNNDDRDELRYIFNLTSTHRINLHMNMSVAAEANLTHIVYLASTRSASNTWNRIIRLSPRLEYFPSREFSTVNTFEVLANYTVYDFEYASTANQGIVFRQFSFVDSSHLNLTRRLSLQWSSTIRFYERGDLQWNAFAERPINYFEDKTYLGKIDYVVPPRLIFSVGIRYFSLSRYEYAGSSRNLQSFLRSIGPITNILWNVGQQTEFSISGWYEHQSQTGVLNRGIANMTMSLTVRI